MDAMTSIALFRHRTDYQIRAILQYNRDGSPDRQKARLQNLLRCVRQLQDRGYGTRWSVFKLSKKEVSRLVDDWHRQGLSHRTVANRMVDIRWLASKVGRLDQVPCNKDLGVGLRKNAPGYGKNKAEQLDPEKLARLPEREQLSTRLRVEFGLRTQEALKFSFQYATGDAPDSIRLKGSWCKGGRPRVVPITTESQRQLLREVGQFQWKNRDRSMIPNHRTFKSYYNTYYELRSAAGVPGHGLRHQWAQQRFETVSGGIKCPLAGGPSYQELSPADQARWDQAAEVVNHELGHGVKRLDITATYIGGR